MPEITSIDDYFATHGHHLVVKTTAALRPLHVPGTDPVPECADSLRPPFEPQAHVIAATIKMLDEVKRGIIAAEMGTGKTIIGMLSVHEHAKRSVRKGGCNGAYRALVLCPDHLIKKWRDELVATIPGVKVVTFDPEGVGCRQLITDMNRLYTELRQDNGRWRKPEGPEWYILGRDQSKLMPARAPVGSEKMGFSAACDNTKIGGERRVSQIGVDSEGLPITEAKIVYQNHPPGKHLVNGSTRKALTRYRNKDGEYVTEKYTEYVCPACGKPVFDKNGKPIDLAKEKKLLNCTGLYAKEIPSDNHKGTGLDITPTACKRRNRWIIFNEHMKPGNTLENKEAGTKFKVCACNEPLWQFTTKPRRWPPGIFLAKKMPGLFRYMIADEVHEQKSATTAQANAFGKLASSSRYCLALTGTIIGGYARDIFNLLMRTNARPLLQEGFEWRGALKFTRQYGRIERTVTTRTSHEDGEVRISRNTRSMRKDDDEKQDERPAPGIMPALFGRHLIDKTIFLSLEDLADNLPKFQEYFGVGPRPDYDEEDHHFYIDCRVRMSDELRGEYERVEKTLAKVCEEMLVHGSMKMLSTLLIFGLEYPDRPWDWRAPTEVPHHWACGYWELPGNRSPENWRGVAQPRSLPQDVIYPKEQALLDIVEREVAAGNQVWVYVQMTNKRDVQPRLKKLLEDHGITASILRSRAVKPRDRLEWIEKEGRKAQVIISHPQLVQTGIDFFRVQNGGYSHNYNAIVFYETGYNLFTLRQASRRAWRIGQSKGCRVYYLHYDKTMQLRAMNLMARKMAAALALDGELTVEGLTALDDSGSAAMALARSIAENIDDADIGRNWAKVGSAIKKATRGPLIEMGEESIEEIPLDGLDLINMEAALLAQTLIDNASEGKHFSRSLMAELFQQYFDQAEAANY